MGREQSRSVEHTPLLDQSMGLILRSYDALNMGILVVSHEGIVHHYNSTYAELRNIALGEMVGHPVATLDRRESIGSFLRSGALPPAKPADLDLRRNQETLLPIQEEGQMLGCIVLVTPLSEGFHAVVQGSRRRSLSKENGATPWSAQYTFADIVGDSQTLVYARELAMHAAKVDSPILLLGESGTGKELFAHAIHMASPRHDRPFVPVDCSAISRELLEAELFGYAPGAFTGAVKDGKPGKFELADGGTVFLDEIGEMPLEMQAKLLRVLQERRIIRVGGLSPVSVDFRIIAATNRNMESMVTEKRFRHDLLYRLDVIRVEIPSLRERSEDIPLLLEHTWEQKSQELGIATTLSPQALRILTRYLWPGNIRELRNLVERLLVSVRKPVVEPYDLPLHVKQGLADGSQEANTFYLKSVVAEAERQTLERALQYARGNRNMAAELVGLSRASFYRKLKEYGMTRDELESELL
jgi:transcriptional regulator with PAS, ATPase and Fis domain